jgi:hypothetical protein
VALTSLDGPDPYVRNQYLAWLTERMQHPNLDRESWGARGCFAAGVAAVLGGGQAWEAQLVERLERAHAKLSGPPTEGGCGGDLDFQDLMDGAVWQGTEETLLSALDYMTGLALAWLHVLRNEDAGRLVTTARFPAFMPRPAWPEPVVPHRICDAARTGRVPLPLEALTADPRSPRPEGVPLFAEPVPPKPAEPPPSLPPPPTQLLCDVQVAIREENLDVDTGIELVFGDEFELEATGTLTPRMGLGGGGPIGPNGWADRVTYEPGYPLHGAIDPVHAHPYCLLGKLNGYFFAGAHRPRQRYLAREPRRLYLRINDDAPGNGTGLFFCRVRVWGAPRG